MKSRRLLSGAQVDHFMKTRRSRMRRKKARGLFSTRAVSGTELLTGSVAVSNVGPLVLGNYLLATSEWLANTSLSTRQRKFDFSRASPATRRSPQLNVSS